MVAKRQILARIGCGLSAMGALAWMLWPNDFGFLSNPEPIFVFGVALVVWVCAEFFDGQNTLGEQLSKANPERPSENDLRISRELLGYEASILRSFLKEHDFHNSYDARYQSEASALLEEFERKIFLFQHPKLKAPLSDFMSALHDFTWHLTEQAGPIDSTKGIFRNSVWPRRRDAQNDEARKRTLRQIKKANELADTAWNKLEALCEAIREVFPSSLDEPLDMGWKRSDAYDIF